MFKWDFWKKKKRHNEIETVPWRQGFDRYADTTRSSLFSAGDDDWDVTTAKPEFSSLPSNNSRSYDDFLRARGHIHSPRAYDSGGPSYGGYNGRRMYGEEDQPGISGHRAMQVLGAIALTAVLYFTFQSQAPIAQKVQAFATESLTKDTDLTAISSWWQQNVSENLALPASTTPQAEAPQFVLPVTGTIKTPFDGAEQQGVTFQTALGAEVKAAAKGIVEKVEKEAGSEDYTVTVSHGTAGKTIYRHLVTVDVKQDAWLETGQKIGAMTQKGEHGTLFFAYQVDDKFLNPADILKLPAAN
ncbi:peptidase M23-like protein [Tumebacillus sp. BK434]|uniref:M23 family metallopeptidase n=1 Tax=Tumebacillus sp. BK434 TaxID=2512169 RepID=UPI0010521DA8|nr:M23 family metallopeptidase [Tumebacillus sp. BK434]TCP59667.1 peptidase M23-like protein [Tumebacillus sp. BK434]